MESIELYKILTIEDETGKERDYTVANILNYQNTTYLYLIEVDKEEKLIESNQMIVRLVMDNENQSVEKVTEQKELQEVSRLFYDLFKNDLEDVA